MGSAQQAPDTRPKPENPGKNSGKIKVFVSLSSCTTLTTDHPNLLQSFDSLVREALIKILGLCLLLPLLTTSSQGAAWQG